MTTTALPGGTFTMGEDLTVTRMGYGAMRLAGPNVFGPPADRDAAIAVLRKVGELGITHIDTSDYYGPYVTNQIIKEALAPYPDGLHIVTKVGARRDAHGGVSRRCATDEVPGIGSRCSRSSTAACHSLGAAVDERSGLPLTWPPVREWGSVGWSREWVVAIACR
jgi:hypothetical protein